MPLDLTATTPQGARLVERAERLAASLAADAAAHDRAGSYPHAGIDALRAEGVFVAPLPEPLGGLGVSSVHDLVVAAARLARGDASLAIGVNMHLVLVGNYVRRHAMAVAAGDDARVRAAAAALAPIADGAIMAAAISEPGQDLTRPATTAEPCGDGWRIDGRKIFCTMAPAATVLLVAVRLRGRDGEERYGYARVPADAPGVEIEDDWDALGMRASGSHSVTFAGVRVARGAVTGGFRVGDAVSYMNANLTAGLFHAAATLGIAEAAHARMAAACAARNGTLDARAAVLAGENAVDLTAARAALARGAALIDEHHAAHPADPGPDEAVVALFAEAQAVKTFVNEAGVRIVDRALSASGGAGYANGNPLSRAYRDVRAGGFMHPLGANRAYEFLSRVTLGAVPALH